jgi:hypothetical protein
MLGLIRNSHNYLEMTSKETLAAAFLYTYFASVVDETKI